jgi:hypothetical protein
VHEQSLRTVHDWRRGAGSGRGAACKAGMFGTSGHVTAKSSIFPWGMLYKSGVYARNVLCLTPGGLSVCLR